MKERLVKISEVFKALGDPTRLRMIRLLASDMVERLGVVDLALKLNLTQPAASQHLKILKNIGILYSEKKGNHVFYHIDTDTLKILKTDIDDLLRFAISKCSKDGDCANCPSRDECENQITSA